MTTSRILRVQAAGGILLLTLAACQGDTPATPTETSSSHRLLSPPAAQVAIQDLGTLGGARSEANDINASGQVTGYAWNAAGKSRVFVWDAVNGMHDIGLALNGAGAGITSAGEIAGTVTPPSAVSRAFFWSPQTGNTLLPFLPGGFKQTVGSDVNDAKVVVGSGVGPQRKNRAFQWNASGGLTMLPLLQGSTQSEALAINESGWIVGSSWGFSGKPSRRVATLWRPGQPPFNLDALLSAHGNSIARGINDDGDIVGYRVEGAAQHGVLWPAGGTFADITGTTASTPAEAISNADKVTGAAINPLFRAYRWDAVNGLVDLGTLPGMQSGSGGMAINNAGQIVGFSYVTPADRHAVLWQ